MLLLQLRFLLFPFLLFMASATFAQVNLNYALHANIIYRFTKYIDWPDEKKSGDFVIGIIGDSPLYDEIESFTANKIVGKQKIVIKNFSASAKAYNCQVLFVNDDESRHLKRIATLTQGLPILLITESPGLALKGSCINFSIVDEHLKLEINKKNLEQRHFSVASDFFGMGVLVKN
ncbi:MAG: YfiR family protein [Ferruginibacter sp.]